MKLAVFGGTGKTGQHLIKQALEAGHTVITLARTPSKLAEQHDRLTVIEGDVLNAEKVSQTVSGADAVISLLSPSSNAAEFVVSRGTENILTAMQQHDVERLLVSAGAGVGDPKDTPKFINHVISFLLKTTARNVYEDMLRVVEIVRASNRNWTVVRVPMLTDGPKTGSIRVGYVGNGTGPRLSRADMADFMLRVAENNQYRHEAPVISN